MWCVVALCFVIPQENSPNKTKRGKHDCKPWLKIGKNRGKRRGVQCCLPWSYEEVGSTADQREFLELPELPEHQEWAVIGMTKAVSNLFMFLQVDMDTNDRWDWMHDRPNAVKICSQVKHDFESRFLHSRMLWLWVVRQSLMPHFLHLHHRDNNTYFSVLLSHSLGTYKASAMSLAFFQGARW